MLVSCKVSIHSTISRNKLSLFRQRNSITTSKSKLKAVSLKQDRKLFASLYVACQSRESDLGEFFSHENHAYPPSLSEYRKLRKGNKADFLQIIETHGDTRLDCPEMTATVIDGAALVQMTLPGDVKTFREYCSKLFVPKILQELRADGRRRVDVLFDRYLQTSLKTETREKRGGGIRVSVRESTPICKNWRQFLRVDKNKEELFTMLAVELGNQNANENTIIATALENAICNDISVNLASLAPSNHEEADTRIFLHTLHAARSGHLKICIRTVDTDVVAIALSVFNKLQIQELWIEFGTGIHKRWLPIHEYAANLRIQVCAAILVLVCIHRL